MNRAANTYWDSRRDQPIVRRSTRRSQAAPPPGTRRRIAPWWLSMVILGSIFAMVCVSINLRAYSAVQEEVDQNTTLSGQIQSLVDENLVLQEEIHMLKTNPAMIQREARKIGVDLKQQKFPVPAN